jgi:hypothetical protein
MRAYRGGAGDNGIERAGFRELAADGASRVHPGVKVQVMAFRVDRQGVQRSKPQRAVDQHASGQISEARRARDGGGAGDAGIQPHRTVRAREAVVNVQTGEVHRSREPVVDVKDRVARFDRPGFRPQRPDADQCLPAGFQVSDRRDFVGGRHRHLESHQAGRTGLAPDRAAWMHRGMQVQVMILGRLRQGFQHGQRIGVQRDFDPVEQVPRTGLPDHGVGARDPRIDADRAVHAGGPHVDM